MIVIADGLMLCEDCLMVACNGDASGIESDERVAAVNKGLDALGPHLVPDFDNETERGIHDFSRSPCDCCGTRLHGSRHEFAILGPDPEPLVEVAEEACT